MCRCLIYLDLCRSNLLDTVANSWDVLHRQKPARVQAQILEEHLQISSKRPNTNVSSWFLFIYTDVLLRCTCCVFISASLSSSFHILHMDPVTFCHFEQTRATAWIKACLEGCTIISHWQFIVLEHLSHTTNTELSERHWRDKSSGRRPKWSGTWILWGVVWSWGRGLGSLLWMPSCLGCVYLLNKAAENIGNDTCFGFFVFICIYPQLFVHRQTLYNAAGRQSVIVTWKITTLHQHWCGLAGPKRHPQVYLNKELISCPNRPLQKKKCICAPSCLQKMIQYLLYNDGNN